jgi:hypothetical protein
MVYRAPPMKECTMQQYTKDDFLSGQQALGMMIEKGVDKIDVPTLVALGYECEHMPKPCWSRIDPDRPELGLEPRWQALAFVYFLDRLAERRALYPRATA